MAIKQDYQKWEKDLGVWKNKLRHLQWISAYRLNIIQENLVLKDKTVLDVGSGPQFTTELMANAGATVLTLDKFAPCDLCCDVNENFIPLVKEKVDLVVIGAVIRYVKDKATFFSRIQSILKPGGWIFVDEFVHNYFNDLYLEFMVLSGSMEAWPKENFTPLEKLEEIIEDCSNLSIKRLYSCWPSFYLEGKYHFSTWYSLMIQKKKGSRQK